MKIDCDSGIAINFLTSTTVSTHPLDNISCYKMKIHDHWYCTIKHIYCEQNAVVDALATRSYNLGFASMSMIRLLTYLKIFLLRMLGVL